METFENASDPPSSVLLLTGVPGVGKTTVIQRVAALLREERPGGFYTEEIRERGERKGFRLRTFAGEERVIAHVDFSTRQRIGKYGVDVAALEEMVVKSLAPTPEISVYLVDEIGKMECLSQQFVSSMQDLLSSGKPIVATVARHGTGFIAEVKQCPDCLLWEVTHENRTALPERAAAWLNERRLLHS